MRRKRIRAIIQILIGVLILLAFWVYLALAVPVGKSNRPQMVDIREGASLSHIGHRLRERGLIRNATIFIWWAQLTGKDTKIKQGIYPIRTNLTALEILDWLSTGKAVSYWVTIPEGFTIDQIAQALAEKGLADAKTFRTLAKRQGARFITPFPKPSGSLEGYLFPDTYQIARGTPEAEIIQRMLDRFHEVVWMRSIPLKMGKRKASLHDIITLASLVEAEAKLPRERPIIAAVLLNRLEMGRKLECDATVQYALGKRVPRLYHKHLTVNSAYNTYLHAGLPPGPINSPGMACIRSSIHPASVDYLYYVAKSDGSHIFSRTIDEHRQAIKRARATYHPSGGESSHDRQKE